MPLQIEMTASLSGHGRMLVRGAGVISGFLSCAYMGVRMRVTIRYRSQPARKSCFNDVRVWLGLVLGVETMFNGVHVAKD